MSLVQLAGNGFGGVIYGNFGTYTMSADGTFTVDTRDVPSLLATGMSYITPMTALYSTPVPPLAAAVGGVVASTALSNGTLAVGTQTDVMRPVNVEVGTGTLPITAGTATITYRGNDGLVGTDTFSLACPLSASVTQTLSRGVVNISAITVAGVVGGVSPWIRLSRTAAISVPVGPGAVDFAVTREYDAAATIAIGTLASALGSIAPTTAPNGTVQYSFMYVYASTVQ
jgi:hypothetical protein